MPAEWPTDLPGHVQRALTWSPQSLSSKGWGIYSNFIIYNLYNTLSSATINPGLVLTNALTPPNPRGKKAL